jgi:hypothetical protein
MWARVEPKAVCAMLGRLGERMYAAHIEVALANLEQKA